MSDLLALLDAVNKCCDDMCDLLPDDQEGNNKTGICSNMVANIVADLNEINALTDQIRAKLVADSEYVDVLRTCKFELELLGGLGLDIDEVSEKLADSIMENGYWDIYKTVISEEKLIYSKSEYASDINEGFPY
jgi:hypothetical protein